MSTFQIVVEAEQQNGGPKQERTLEENETLPACQTRSRVWINPPRDG